jgi:hypothetical protein
MPELFDPYHAWLGIESPQRPLNYYQLLGLKPCESDRDHIERAVMMQMAHVLRHEVGPYGDLVSQLCEELAAAEACLTNPVRKAEYDARLREQAEGPEPDQTASADGEAADDLDFVVASAGEVLPPSHGVAGKGEQVALARPTAAEHDVSDRDHVLGGEDEDDEERAGRTSKSRLDLQRAKRAAGSSVGQSAASQIKKSQKGKKQSRELVPTTWIQGAVAAVVLVMCGAFIISRFWVFDFRPNPKYELIVQLEHADPALRIAAAQGLQNAGPDDDSVPALLKLLHEDKDDRVRAAAAAALGNATSDSKTQVVAELNALASKEQSARVRSAIKSALETLQPPAGSG